MPQIHLDGLIKRYGSVQVLHGIELEMADNEFTVLVGPSGCGKSTTLRMIAGLESVSEGEIYIDGQPVSHLEPKDRELAMVFQDYALYPHMNVAQNISFALRLAKRPRAEIDSKVVPCLAVSAKGLRWHVLWRKTARFFCLMSRFRIWMQSCAVRCGRNWH